MSGDGGGRPARSTVGRTLRQGRTIAVTARERLEDDPVRFGVLAVRRLPPRLRAVVARGLVGVGRRVGGTALHGLGLVLADRPQEAVSVLAGAPLRGRLAGEVAVELAIPLPEDADPALRARAAWSRGDLSGAVALAAAADGPRGRRRAARLESERRTYLPGHRLPAPARRVDPARSGGPRALHLLTNSLPWTQSGYAVRSHGILRAQHRAGIGLGAVTRVGYPVTVGLPWAAAEDVVDGVPYRRLLPDRLAPTPESRLEQTADLLAGHVARLRPSVLHTTTHFVNALVVEAVARGAGLPWVYEMRGQLERTWLASHPVADRPEVARSERYRLWRDRELELAAAADHVVALSAVLRDQLVAAGLPAERVTVVPNAVDEALLAEPVVEPAAARRRLGLPDDGFWVGSVSSLVGYEGLDTLLRAVALLRSTGADVRCALAGDGAEAPALRGLVHDLGLDGSVVMPGRVPRHEAPWWHRALDVFVVPRRDTDVTRSVTPLKPVEAMALGRPVVVSDLPALTEVVGGGRAGVPVRPEDPAALADTLRGLSADAALRAELAASGRELASTRTWAAMTERYRSIYESLESAT